MIKNPEVLTVCSDDELLKSLDEANQLLEQVRALQPTRHLHAWVAVTLYQLFSCCPWVILPIMSVL